MNKVNTFTIRIIYYSQATWERETLTIRIIYYSQATWERETFTRLKTFKQLDCITKTKHCKVHFNHFLKMQVMDKIKNKFLLLGYFTIMILKLIFYFLYFINISIIKCIFITNNWFTKIFFYIITCHFSSMST